MFKSFYIFLFVAFVCQEGLGQGIISKKLPEKSFEEIIDQDIQNSFHLVNNYSQKYDSLFSIKNENEIFFYSLRDDMHFNNSIWVIRYDKQRIEVLYIQHTKEYKDEEVRMKFNIEMDSIIISEYDSLVAKAAPGYFKQTNTFKYKKKKYQSPISEQFFLIKQGGRINTLSFHFNYFDFDDTNPDYPSKSIEKIILFIITNLSW